MFRGDNRFRINFKIDQMIKRGFDHDLSAADKQHIIDLYDGCVMEFDHCPFVPLLTKPGPE